MDQGFKRCCKCGIVKPLSEFNKDKKRKDGLQSRCRACDKERNAQYRKTHKEYFKLKSQESYNPALNPVRYAKNRNTYLQKKKEYSESVRGRFVSLLYSAKTRANKLNLPYELDLDWLMSKYNEQNKRCLLTGIELTFESTRGGKRSFKPFSPSLDRINAAEGYTKENTRLVCTYINLAMNSFGEDMFVKVAKAYLNQNCT